MTITLTESHVAGLRLLISQLRAVQPAHRAGIPPHYGQLENLYETTDVIERQLDGLSSTPARETCDTPNCGRPMVRCTTEGQKVCVDCASALVARVIFGDKPPAMTLHTSNGHGGHR